ncbi:DNA directed RNA polymerase-like protein III subunit Rpc82 [Phyllosticta citriasiana]|uniref:DNA directed RNA polymerase-like protein III subunit Rpc82 n=1 Tax=Phyllosticta citriasiana TaxID=595635 RepID=UPI0030FDD34C
MAEHISELCTLLVEDLYGELSSRVFSLLAKLGRLSIRGLLQSSNLTLRELKHGLVVLIQQHLVLHYTGEEETFYEPDWQHAYALVRYGKIVKIIEDRFGDAAGGLASNLLLLGNAQISDLAQAYGVATKKEASNDAQVNGNGVTNGDHGEEIQDSVHIKTIDDLHRVLRQLLESGFVTKIHAKHFHPTSDLRNEAERMIKVNMFPTGVKGKEIIQFNAEVNNLLAKWRDEASSGDNEQLGSGAGTKRSATDTQAPARKRIKIGVLNGSSYGAAPKEVPLEDDLVVCINQDKCVVAIRTQQLVDFAEQYIGQITAQVYEAMLRQLEKKVPCCSDPYNIAPTEEDEAGALPTVTAREVMEALDPNLDLASGIGTPQDADTPEEDSSASPAPNGTNALANSARITLIKQHISLLCEDPRRFVRWVGSRGGGEYKVDFRPLSNTLLQRELENIVTARWGPLATRLIRILYAKGRLDEKQVSQFSMQRTKEIRADLTRMQEAGFVDTQEVPKDNTRAPARTMYLWFFDADQTRQLVLTDTYKAMARALQRVRHERARVAAVIEKAERTDVVGNEDRFLSATERAALRGWREREERVLVQLARMDDLVAVLRDFRLPVLPKTAWGAD